MAAVDLQPTWGVGTAVARALDGAAGALQRIARSRLSLPLALVLLFGALYAIGQQETGRGDLRVYPVSLADLSASMGGRYVQVSGVINPERTYQTRLKLGPFELRGGTWVAFVTPGRAEVLWLTRESAPTATPGVTQTLVGRLTLGAGQEPPLYLEVGGPPDVAARDRLATAGGLVLAALVGMAALLALGHAVQFVPGLPGRPTERAGEGLRYWWYGALAGAGSPILLRHAPIAITPQRRGLQIAGDGPGPVWSCEIRRVRAARAATIATPEGARAGVRVTFENEHGLKHDAVIAASNLNAREQLLAAFEYVGGQND
ncbi:MAG: hypothetical protein K1X39_12535 [Thermoflexales bacterium]|nr:hypothetical protein [Thermoflexales bacterium]